MPLVAKRPVSSSVRVTAKAVLKAGLVAIGQEETSKADSLEEVLVAASAAEEDFK